MTNKQIIIDGVDVSGCSYYQHNMCTATKDDYGDCSICCQDYDMNDCYYKQLKRKEQECNKFYIQLKADEEYHEEEKNILRKIIKNKEERNIALYKENNKLKQTLTEIKKIIEFGFRPYKVCGKHNNCCDVLSEILQKISEAENAR